MIGLELWDAKGRPAGAMTLRLIKEMLRRGFILLPEGEAGNVISLTPPLTIRRAQLKSAVQALCAAAMAVA